VSARRCSVERAAFEKLVAEALRAVPKRFRKEMRNIAIIVEDEPSAELLREMEPLTERSWRGEQRMPDRILIFQGPHERDSIDDDDLVVAITETLIHEIGHYFGMSEEEIEEIEEQYWRAEAGE
jgi:predicted Zn-dependent protease with MMP-like domain